MKYISCSAYVCSFPPHKTDTLDNRGSTITISWRLEAGCFGCQIALTLNLTQALSPKARRMLVPCISNFQSRKPNNCWLWKYEFGEKSKSRKNVQKNFSPRWIFHKFGAQDWVFKSWVLLDFLQIFTIFQYLLVIYVRFVHYIQATQFWKGCRISKQPLKSRKRTHAVLCAYYSRLKIWYAENVLVKRQIYFLVFLGVCISSLTRYKQGKFAINTHQIYVINIALKFGTRTSQSASIYSSIIDNWTRPSFSPKKHNAYSSFSK